MSGIFSLRWWRCLATLFIGSASSLGADATAEQLAALQHICSKGRYLETASATRWEEDLPGWESARGQLRLSRYRTGLSAPASVSVLLWDPTPETAASWIADAVTQALGHYDHDVARYFATTTLYQSGYQFPVRGFVSEDGKVYVFWDGVTVSLQHQEHPENFPLSPHDLEALSSPNFQEAPLYRAAFSADDREVQRTGRQGRVVSVTKGTPGVPAGDQEFRKFVRDEHLRAMAAKRNELARLKFLHAYGRDRDTAFKALQNEIRGALNHGGTPASDAVVEAAVAKLERD